MDRNFGIKILIFIYLLNLAICKDFYQILGVKPDATDKEIKRRFRQLGEKFQKNQIQ